MAGTARPQLLAELDGRHVPQADRGALPGCNHDVAEFLHRLRTSAYSTTGSAAAAEEPGRAFLDAYREVAGGEEDLANLRLHRARYLVHSYNSQLKSHEPDTGRAEFCLAELEALLLTHPAIADAAVIGVPDEEAGERPRAFIVVTPGQELSPADVTAFTAEHLSTYKVVHDVVFTDAIPKSASGKILRRMLRDA